MDRARRDRQLERIVAGILRAGVIVAALIALVGGALYLMDRGATPPDYRTFRGEPLSLRRVSAIAADAAALQPRGIIQLAIVILLATPLVRVVLSAVAFAVQRDALYVAVTALVFAVLLFSLLGPHLAR